jgi:hypothetical protein
MPRNVEFFGAVMDESAFAVTNNVNNQDAAGGRSRPRNTGHF